MIRNVLFDVDGTLWDSAEPVAQSWNSVLQEKYAGVQDRLLTAKDMYRNMGKTMTDIGLDLFPSLSSDLRDAIMKDVMAYENEYLKDHPGVFYPGLVHALQALRKKGCRLYIVSNCQDGYIQAMLSNTLAPYFDDFECFGRTGLPKDGSIRVLLARDHLLAEESVYVGDTRMDEIAARKAGIRFIHAAYGFGTADAPDQTIHKLAELPSAVAAIGKGSSMEAD